MHLIAPLVAGIRGAELGTAEIYSRGTTNRATRYLDFEASQPISSPSGPVDLDSNGGAVVYVNSLVDVVVSDADGVVVRRFTAGDGAPGVEVISRSFTGTDYETGQQAASKPLPLSTALDRLKTSFGAIDFNVLFNGSSRSLQSALGSVGGLVFNVKDATYGAVGNGVADDTSAVQAAITACHAAGGGIVFFPPGTYSLTALTPTSKTSLVGGGSTSVLALNHASNSLLSWGSVTSTDRPSIEGLRFTLLQNASGRFIDIAATSLCLKIDNCVFDTGSYDATGHLVYEHGTTCKTWLTRSKFLTSASTQRAFRANGQAFVALCEFTVPTNPSFGLYLASMTTGAVIGNSFDCSAASSGTVIGVATAGATYVAGNTFTDGGGATMSISLADSFEVGNTYSSSISFSASTTTPTATTNQNAYISAERTCRRVTLGGAVATYTSPDDCGDLVIVITSSSPTIDVTLPSAAISRRGRVIFINNSGGNRDVHPLPPAGVTARGGGIGVVTVGNGNCYVVDWWYFYSAAATRLMIEQANSGSFFSL